MTVCLGLGWLWGVGGGGGHWVDLSLPLAFPRLAPRRRFPQIVSNFLILSLASLVIGKKNGFILASPVSNRVLEAVFMLRQRRHVSGQKQRSLISSFCSSTSNYTLHHYFLCL